MACCSSVQASPPEAHPIHKKIAEIEIRMVYRMLNPTWIKIPIPRKLMLLLTATAANSKQPAASMFKTRPMMDAQLKYIPTPMQARIISITAMIMHPARRLRQQQQPFFSLQHIFFFQVWLVLKFRVIWNIVLGFCFKAFEELKLPYFS